MFFSLKPIIGEHQDGENRDAITSNARNTRSSYGIDTIKVGFHVLPSEIDLQGWNHISHAIVKESIDMESAEVLSDQKATAHLHGEQPEISESHARPP
jgi:hypothetical protein